MYRAAESEYPAGLNLDASFPQSRPNSFVSLSLSQQTRFHNITTPPPPKHRPALMQPHCDCDERLKPLQTNVRCAARRGGLTVWPLRSETRISISTKLLKKDTISGQKFRTRNPSMPSISSLHALKESNPIDPTALTPPHPLQLRKDPSATAAITTVSKTVALWTSPSCPRTGLVTS